jgi:gluconate 2-dehydrogenase gamma chain
MNRRDLLKTITLSSLGLAGLNPQVYAAEMLAPPDVPLKVPGGRQKFEAERDAKLKNEKFFTPQELLTVTVLADIIIPADDKSGSASQAGVPAFIEFMMKDQPQWQTPMRGGLAWLDNKCRKMYGKAFAQCSKTQQIELVDMIAYPGLAKPEMLQGVSFFSLMRNFTASGFYSSKMGIADIGYQGNKPNQWEGVPEEVLKQYNLSYDD